MILWIISSMFLASSSLSQDIDLYCTITSFLQHALNILMLASSNTWFYNYWKGRKKKVLLWKNSEGTNDDIIRACFREFLRHQADIAYDSRYAFLFKHLLLWQSRPQSFWLSKINGKKKKKNYSTNWSNNFRKKDLVSLEIEEITNLMMEISSPVSILLLQP